MPGVCQRLNFHGYGGIRARLTSTLLDGQPLAMDKAIGSGINLNDLGFADPTREITNTWIQIGSVASVHQGYRQRLGVSPSMQQQYLLLLQCNVYWNLTSLQDS